MNMAEAGRAQRDAPQARELMDKDALTALLAGVDATLRKLVDGDNDADFARGCALLEEEQREQETRARARYESVVASVAMLYEHECNQAKARYAARCEQLKLEMGEEIQREIRRLRQARDGVSVMDRRRLTRHSGATGSNSSLGNGGGVGGAGADANGDGEGSSGATPLTEKKRMEVLLSATPIFRALDKTIAKDEVTSDLALIQETLPLVDSDDDGDATDEDEARELAELRQQQSNAFKRRRLLFNASRLPEGQRVIVYTAASAPAGTSSLSSKKKLLVPETKRELMSGVITAATATQVFVMADDGKFQTIDVKDWKAGRVTVHSVAAADTSEKEANKS